ncbi:MAG: F0F1 ATP synthase subunit epsilon [Longimicrobiales bacterium]
MAATLQVSVISPERTVFEGTAEQVIAPAWDGAIGILRGHAPMLILLGEGDVHVRGAGQDQRFRIAGGFLQVIDDRVTILSEHAQGG